MLINFLKLLRKNILLVGIVILAFVLRFSYLDYSPPSLNWDEVSHGYNAFSILKTGADEWGVKMPTIFRAFGDYKLPVYIYSAAVSIKLFGLNAAAIRLPSVLAGIALVLFTYLLSREIFKDKRIALLSSFLVAVEPWSFFTSRAAFEANLAQAFIVAGIYFFLRAVRHPVRTRQAEGSEMKFFRFVNGSKYSSYFFLLSSMFLGLSVWTYNSARVFVPLLLISPVFIYRSELRKLVKNSKRIIIFSLFVIGIFLLPMFLQLVNPVGIARYGAVEIIDDGAVAQIIKRRQTSSLPTTISRLIYNRPMYFSGKFVANYLNHFSPKFLFSEGSTDYQFSVPGRGVLQVVDLPFYYLGLVAIFLTVSFRYGARRHKVLLAWIFLAPIASSLTRGSPHVLRSMTMLPMPMILISVGVVRAADWIQKQRLGKAKLSSKFTILLYIIIVAASAELYFQNYFLNYREDYSWSWQYGYKQIVDYAKDNYGKYDRIVVTKKYGEPHEFFLFYWPWDPLAYRKDPNLNRFYQSNWYWIDGFDKFYFMNDWQIDEEGTHPFVFVQESGGEVDCTKPANKCLLITSPGNVPDDWEELSTISFLDGSTAFELYEN